MNYHCAELFQREGDALTNFQTFVCKLVSQAILERDLILAQIFPLCQTQKILRTIHLLHRGHFEAPRSIKIVGFYCGGLDP